MHEPHHWSWAHPPPWHPLWGELAAFLDDRFRPEWCNDNDTKVFEECATYPDVATFYRDSEILCYQGIAYWLQGWKRPWHGVLFQLGMGMLHILDYGCGIGQDGISWLDHGYLVTFADQPGRALEFCRWRLDQRGYDNVQVIDLEAETILPGPYNLVWCMDVLEHCPPADQPVLLDYLGTLAPVVLVNLIEDTHADGRVHYPVDRQKITAHVQKTWPVGARDIYTMPDGNMNRLLLYGTGVQCDALGNVTVNEMPVTKDDPCKD